jgi:DNA-binding Lrp family transcriptional regulator
MTLKLDLKDKKILAELDKNCRQASSEIARKVGLSVEVVNYRIKRFEQEGVITQYQTAINLSKLGITAFKVLLSLHHITSEKLDFLINKLKLNKNVKWIASCKGAWDLTATVEADSIDKVEQIKNEIISLFSEFIDKKAISITTQASAYSRGFILGETKDEKILFNVSEKKEELDAVDLKILKKLSEDARKPIVSLAEELKLSERIVNYRIKQLIKREIITGFRVALNYEKLGIRFYKSFVYLDNPREKRVKEFIDYIKTNKNLIHNVHVIGNWEFEPEFETYSEEEFNKILSDIKDKFSDIINKIEIITISKEHKFVYF